MVTLSTVGVVTLNRALLYCLAAEVSNPSFCKDRFVYYHVPVWLDIPVYKQYSEQRQPSTFVQQITPNKWKTTTTITSCSSFKDTKSRSSTNLNQHCNLVVGYQAAPSSLLILLSQRYPPQWDKAVTTQQDQRYS